MREPNETADYGPPKSPSSCLAAVRRAARHLNETVLLRLLDDYCTQLVDLDAREKTAAKELAGLIAATGSTLSELVGIADRSEAELLIEVGDPRRFTGEGGLARFNGSAPLPASSGEGNGPPRRHRLSRGGNRRVNAVLHRMAITRLRCEPKAREIYDRARQRGHTKRELGYTCNVVASSGTPSLEMRALQLD